MQPTKCALRSFTINGYEVSPYVNLLKVYESVCKPYLTGDALIIDNNNLINVLNLQGGETVTFDVITDGGRNYSQTMYILKIKNVVSNQSGRAQSYTLELISKEYFGDRANLVQQSFKDITGTDAIQKIHSRFVGNQLNIPVPSSGLLFKNPNVVSGTKPFKAIDDLRRIISFAGFQTGLTSYFRDRNLVNLIPVEYMFRNMSVQQEFVQKTTWGSDYRDVFHWENAIISATTTIGDKGSYASMLEMSAAQAQEYKVMDVFSNKKIFEVAASALKSVLGGVGAGGHGGRQNYLTIDSQKIPKENVRRTDKETLLRAKITSNLVIKVPIQTGLNCTVGKGIFCRLLAPIGDKDPSNIQPTNAGQSLVADIMHEFHFDDSLMPGTSTIRSVKMEI